MSIFCYLCTQKNKYMTKICCFFNYPPHYRYAIYKAIDNTFDCDFYFGDDVFQPLKTFDVHRLHGFKSFLKAKMTNIKGYIWHKGSYKLFKTSYSYYIVTGESCILVNWLLILWTKITKKKLIMWTHGINQHYPKKTSLLIYKIFYRSADILLMYSKYNLKYMTDLGCKTDKLYYIHNSLNTDFQNEIYANLHESDIYSKHFNNNNPVVIYIGRLQKSKRIEQLIEAIDFLNKEGEKINLVLIGDNSDAEYLQLLVKTKGLEKTTWFYGPSYDEIQNSELIYNASVCVCPAAIGLTAIHALSYGCPIISNNNLSTQMPECECIRDNVTGSFFKENDINDLSSKILYWCSLSHSQRDNFRKEARNLILQEWSIDYQINILKKIIA